MACCRWSIRCAPPGRPWSETSTTWRSIPTTCSTWWPHRSGRSTPIYGFTCCWRRWRSTALARSLGLARESSWVAGFCYALLGLLPLAAQPLQPDRGHGAGAGVRRRLRRIDVAAPARARGCRRRGAVRPWSLVAGDPIVAALTLFLGLAALLVKRDFDRSPPAATRCRSRCGAVLAAPQIVELLAHPAPARIAGSLGLERRVAAGLRAGIRAPRSSWWCRSSSGRPISATGARSCSARDPAALLLALPGSWWRSPWCSPPADRARRSRVGPGRWSSAGGFLALGGLEPVHVLSVSPAAGERPALPDQGLAPGRDRRLAARRARVRAGGPLRARGATLLRALGRARRAAAGLGRAHALATGRRWRRCAARITPISPPRSRSRRCLAGAALSCSRCWSLADRVRVAGRCVASRAAPRRLLRCSRSTSRRSSSCCAPDRHRRHRRSTAPPPRRSPTSTPGERIAHGCPISLGCDLGGPGTYPDWRMSWLERRGWLELYPFVAAQFGLRYAYDVSPEGLDTVLVFAGTARAARAATTRQALRLLAAAAVDVRRARPPGGRARRGTWCGCAVAVAVDRRRSLDLRDHGQRARGQAGPRIRGGDTRRIMVEMLAPDFDPARDAFLPGRPDGMRGTRTAAPRPIESESRERVRIRTASASRRPARPRPRLVAALPRPVDGARRRAAPGQPRAARARASGRPRTGRDLGRPPALRGRARRQRAGSARSLRARVAGRARESRYRPASCDRGRRERPPLVSATTVLKNRPVGRCRDTLL